MSHESDGNDNVSKPKYVNFGSSSILIKSLQTNLLLRLMHRVIFFKRHINCAKISNKKGDGLSENE